MGKSAKFLKRVKKPKTKPSTAVTPNASSSSTTQPQVQAAKKRENLKKKTALKASPKSKGVLGGADYVTLLMGGRRKVEIEAKKLPQDNS